jgi:hypothetical protein
LAANRHPRETAPPERRRGGSILKLTKFRPSTRIVTWGVRHEDYQAHLEKLRTDAAECALIRDLATDPAKRELFDRLAVHLSSLANQVEAAMLHLETRQGSGKVRPASVGGLSQAAALRRPLANYRPERRKDCP